MTIDNSDVHIYADLKDRDLKTADIFICEGRYGVERLLASDYNIISILTTPSNSDYFTALAGDKCPVIIKTKEELSTITGFNFHRGVLAAAQRPFIPDIEEFLGSSPHTTGLILIPSLSEGENIGSIVRSARAFSFNGLIVGPRCADPFTRKAIRCSMGTIFSLPLASYTMAHMAVTTLHNHGFTIIGATLSPSAYSLPTFQFPEKCVFVIGHESEGLTPPWDHSCDTYVRIDIAPGIDSLNAGVAAGIILHAFSRVV